MAFVASTKSLIYRNYLHKSPLISTVQRHTRLIRRKGSGRYYCRAVVPKDLISAIGKREIKISLGASDYKLACERVLLLG